MAIAAQERIPDSRERQVEAARVQGDITIDGRLDELDWALAGAVSGFIQDEPFEGEPAMEETVVRVLYDDQNLYVGARVYESDPSRIASQLTRRGVTGRAADYFEVSVDPNRDRTTGYQFRVTAAGVQRDRYLYDDTSGDDSWNGVWESAAHQDEEGWTAELRIPLSQLRYEASNGAQVWGVNFARRRVAENERSEWAWKPRGVPGTVSRFGQLHGLELPERGRHVEVLPYIAADLRRSPAHTDNPFFERRELRSRAGADIRYALSSAFVLDLALQPDFGQVEVDPQVINLGAFETFFPEQRPFFTRDDRIFDFGLSGRQNTLFHSRRIGRRPAGSPPLGVDFFSMPTETTILGAAKVTGRTAAGLNVGVLAAVTDREHGSAARADGGDYFFQRFEAEPRTHYGIVRLEQDLREGQSRVGGIVTLVDRDLPGDGSLDFMPRRAVAAGLDFEHSWADREWSLSGHFVGSDVRGSAQAITRVQRSPNHRHQRPDQDYLTLDPEATRLTGEAWRLQLNRRSRHWSGGTWLARRTPGFEVNDLGFSTATERVEAGGRISYSEPAPAGDRLQRYSIGFMTVHNWRNSVREDLLSSSAWRAAHSGGRFNFDVDLTFRNWWELSMDASYRPGVLSDQLTRGGPLMLDPGERSFGVSLRTDRRADVTWNASLDYDDGAHGSGGYQVSLGVEARPTNRLNLRANFAYTQRQNARQYVIQRQDPSFEPTYGGRYFFADLDREELSINLRADVIFSPTLSLELFLQPLIAAGDFTGYKQLARAGSFDFLHLTEGEAIADRGGVSCIGGALCRHEDLIYLSYLGGGAADTSFREQNFTVRSLRGNAVLRWEYRPGSRVYGVWQHSREQDAPLGDFDLSRDGRALLSSSGEHMFMIKVDHWFAF